MPSITVRTEIRRVKSEPTETLGTVGKSKDFARLDIQPVKVEPAEVQKKYQLVLGSTLLEIRGPQCQKIESLPTDSDVYDLASLNLAAAEVPTVAAIKNNLSNSSNLSVTAGSVASDMRSSLQKAGRHAQANLQRDVAAQKQAVRRKRREKKERKIAARGTAMQRKDNKAREERKQARIQRRRARRIEKAGRGLVGLVRAGEIRFLGVSRSGVWRKVEESW